MSRLAIPLLFVIALTLSVFAWGAPRSIAQTGTPGTPAGIAVNDCINPASVGTPTPESGTGMGSPNPLPTPTPWWEQDVRPPLPNVGRVFPALPSATPFDGSPTPHYANELYLVVVTLRPGACTPYEAPGNQKNGGVMWMVQQGKVTYAWRRAAGTPAGATPVVEIGNVRRNLGMVQEGEAITLYPGDWITQNQKVEVTWRNVGGDSAVILKAVFAEHTDGGCPGDCR